MGKITDSMQENMSTLLDHDQVEFYRQEGYLVLKSVFSAAEVEALGDDVLRVTRDHKDLIHSNNLRVRFKNHVSSKHDLFEVLDPISDLSPVADEFAHSPRILDRLECIYGEPACLFKDKLIYKPAGAIGATLHQDWIGWPGFPESFLTVLVAIDPFTKESGATCVYPRLHKRGYLSPKDGNHHQLEHEAMECEAVPLILEPGDVAIFSCFTPHYSEANESDQFRRGYFLSYNARSDGGEQFESHYKEFHDWIRAKSPIERRPSLIFE
jgi:2-aminoethylphosphonate dioxygenase